MSNLQDLEQEVLLCWGITVVLVNKDRYGCTVEVRDKGGNIHVFSGKVY